MPSTFDAQPHAQRRVAGRKRDRARPCRYSFLTASWIERVAPGCPGAEVVFSSSGSVGGRTRTNRSQRDSRRSSTVQVCARFPLYRSSNGIHPGDFSPGRPGRGSKPRYIRYVRESARNEPDSGRASRRVHRRRVPSDTPSSTAQGIGTTPSAPGKPGAPLSFARYEGPAHRRSGSESLSSSNAETMQECLSTTQDH